MITLLLLSLVGTVLLCMVLASVMSGWWWFKTELLIWFCGYKLVKFYDGQYHFNEDFSVAVKFDDNGNPVAPVYRYQNSNIGDVVMHNDGTADFCGKYKWVKV